MDAHCAALRAATTLLKYDGLGDPATLLRERPEMPITRLSQPAVGSFIVFATPALMAGNSLYTIRTLLPARDGRLT